MAIDVKSLVPSASTSVIAPENPSSQLGKADFMKLLIAQLRNQDPLNPMDSRDMIAQLATLSSVEKLTSMDQTMAQMRAESAGMASMQATSLIGRTVTARADHLVVPLAGSATSQYSLGAAAKTVSVSVIGAGGMPVRTLELGAQPAGQQTLTWDGLDDRGMRAEPGRYSYRITAKSDAGQPVLAETQISGVVSQLSFKNGTPELVIGSTAVSLTDVVSIAP